MKKIILAAVLALVYAAPVFAEPIIVGTFTMDRDGIGAVSLTSQNGFNFTGRVSAYSGIFNGWQLSSSQSQPGMDINLGAYFVGSSATGTGTLGTRAFTNIGGLDSDDSMEMRFASGVIAPALLPGAVNGDEVTLTTTFSFAGTFRYLADRATFTPGLLDLLGMGQCDVTLRAFTGDGQTPPMWDFGGARYTFRTADTTGAHAPEPTTWLLLGTGLAGVIARRKRA